MENPQSTKAYAAHGQEAEGKRWHAGVGGGDKGKSAKGGHGAWGKGLSQGVRVPQGHPSRGPWVGRSKSLSLTSDALVYSGSACVSGADIAYVSEGVRCPALCAGG